MGQDWRPNKAMSNQLILAVLRACAHNLDVALDNNSRKRWLNFGTYLVITYVLSLRGVEGLLVDLAGMIEHRDRGDDKYFFVVLLGKTKMEEHGRSHLLPCTNVTSSRINVKQWVHMLLTDRLEDGYVDGPFFVDKFGKVMTTHALDDCLTEVLEDLYDNQPLLFPLTIKTKEDISGSYQVFRTPRRSSATRAQELNVSVTDIDMVNRWHKFEQARGNRPTMVMRQHYTQIELILAPFIRYTTAM